MAQQTAGLDAAQLRERLMAAEPMQRFTALHALDCVLKHCARPPNPRLAQEIEDFIARGMPFYSSVDPHYLEWVDQAVEYWDRLQRRRSPTAVRAAGERRVAPAAIQA
jgi:hypothetical protein